MIVAVSPRVSFLQISRLNDRFEKRSRRRHWFEYAAVDGIQAYCVIKQKILFPRQSRHRLGLNIAFNIQADPVLEPVFCERSPIGSLLLSAFPNPFLPFVAASLGPLEFREDLHRCRRGQRGKPRHQHCIELTGRQGSSSSKICLSRRRTYDEGEKQNPK